MESESQATVRRAAKLWTNSERAGGQGKYANDAQKRYERNAVGLRFGSIHPRFNRFKMRDVVTAIRESAGRSVMIQTPF